jgi:Na+-transporting NADH:ubiquinone oxidoreductase subunit C
MYVGKTVFEGEELVGITLKKGGAAEGAQHEVDAITGGTKTSDGVSAMIKDCLVSYKPYFEAAKPSECACCDHKSNELNTENNGK